MSDYGSPLAGPGPLIDIHAHFYQSGSGRSLWSELTASRLAAGERRGITWHVGSILGSWGARSPVYFQSPADTVAGNDAMLQVLGSAPKLNPNYRSYDPKDDKRVTTALIEAARYNRKDYVMSLLSIPGIYKNAKDSLAYRAIDRAATNGHFEMVELLK